ncbi:MAG: phage major capsid protein [Alphaproteobacteria bacterium]
MNKRLMLSASALTILMPMSMSAPRMDGGAPTLEAIKGDVEKLGKTFHAFKESNDKVLAEIKKNGSADPLLKEQVDKINNDMGDVSKRVDEFIKAQEKKTEELQLSIGRNGLGGGDGEVDIRAQAANFFTMMSGKLVKPSDADVEKFQSYQEGLNSYCRQGGEKLSSDIRNALSVGADSGGGYFVPPERSAQVIKRLFDTSPVRQHANVQTIGSDKLITPVDKDSATSGGWSSETSPPTDTDNSKVGMQTIEIHEQWAQPKATQQLLEDAVVDVEGWLMDKIADILARTENAAFVNGNGKGKPRGFMSYSAAAVSTDDASRAWGKIQFHKTGTSAAFGVAGADKLIDVVHSMKAALRPGAIWTANRKTFAEIRKLKDGEGNYLWSMGDITKGQPSALLGYGTDDFDDIEDIGANSFSLAFANLKEGYKILDRLGITILRDPFTGKPFVKFYARKRVGGDVENFDAIKYVKFAA